MLNTKTKSSALTEILNGKTETEYETKTKKENARTKSKHERDIPVDQCSEEAQQNIYPEAIRGNI